MKPDIYTKAALTVIAFAVTAIAFNQYVHPSTIAEAQGPFAGVQFMAGDGGAVTAVDTRTGDVWHYYNDGTPFPIHWRITKLGQPGVREK